jgi:hypothetical protein
MKLEFVKKHYIEGLGYVPAHWDLTIFNGNKIIFPFDCKPTKEEIRKRLVAWIDTNLKDLKKVDV